MSIHPYCVPSIFSSTFHKSRKFSNEGPSNQTNILIPNCSQKFIVYYGLTRESWLFSRIMLPTSNFLSGGGGAPSSTNLSNDQLTVKSIPSLYQRKLVLNKSALFVSLDPSKFPPQHHLHRKSVLIHISNRRHLSLRRVLLHTLSIN